MQKAHAARLPQSIVPLCEKSRQHHDELVAWELLEQITSLLREGKTEEQIQEFYEDCTIAHLLPAAQAVLFWITAYQEKKTRERQELPTALTQHYGKTCSTALPPISGVMPPLSRVVTDLPRFQ
jgi:hypothetical protein